MIKQREKKRNDKYYNEEIIADILNILGIKFVKSGDNLMACCPNPEHEDKNPSWGINVNTGLHNCFSCGFKGDIKKLLSLYGIMSEGKIIKKQIRTFSRDRLKNKLGRQNNINYIAYLPKVFSLLDDGNIRCCKHVGYLLSRLVNKDNFDNLVNRFYLGFVPSGRFYNRIIFPIYKRDLKNKRDFVVMYGGRSVSCVSKGVPKYLYPVRARKSNYLYNHNHCLLNKFKSVIVVEGVFDVFRLWELGIYNVVSTLGCWPSKAQLHFLQYYNDITICYDNDEAGNKGLERFKEYFYSGIKNEAMVLRKKALPIGIDPGCVKNIDDWRRLPLQKMFYKRFSKIPM
ncbi:MAG: toprim domain-containing protein [Candidatus Lokiarchaeota archaeon]|nr:toprim domain-containing protein [Candidatus Lokiarchaeota archaeon]